MKKKPKSKNILMCNVLRKHFGKLALEDIITTRRSFPITSRVDLQIAFDHLFSKRYQGKLIGIHGRYESPSFNQMSRSDDSPALVGSLQYDDIDIGEIVSARCLKQGLWLSKAGNIDFAVLLFKEERYGRTIGVTVEIAVPPGELGLKLSRSFLDLLEKIIRETGSYRGKVISLDASDDYSGRIDNVKVHKLRSVKRDEVILPGKTLQLLERNVSEFISQRENLRKLGMAAKKGLLFYGPPGTGKTHTIHYLASQLPNHTTMLITSEQMGLLDKYFQLARFLQPAMIIIEDVDLIARSRNSMRNPCEESLLNRLLNEMDGLREDAEILFVLTTNRPEELEVALASRPGRIDQAIEFPLPDDDGRRKLATLYAKGMNLSPELLEKVVRKTKKASGAFIKELMRRCAQTFLRDGAKDLRSEHIESALEEILFSGGSLNVKLLGGAGVSE